MQKNNTFTFKSITNNEMNVYENEKSYIEKQTNISKNILSKLRSIAIANKLAIILRPVNPAAFALIKRNAVGKNMFVHGKSAEEGLAKGLIPLRSSISKAGNTNDIQNIQKYNSENEHSINNSCKVFEDIKSKHKLEERISEDKFEELVFSVKLLDKENRQIFIFENKDNLALKDNSNKHVYAIKDSGTFRLIDENHELVDENHKKIDNDVDKAKAAQWLKDKIAKEYSNEREVEVFGKPKIKEEDGTLKIKEVQPITADIDVLAYGYSIQTSGRKYSDVGNFQTLLEDGRRKIIKDSGVSLSYEEEKNLINKGIQDIGNLHLPDDMISKFKDLEFSSVYLSGMGDGTEITHAITGSMRATFPNIEISHGPEQFNLRFPQPLDKEWICISYKQQSDNINEESKAVDGITILHNEQELVDAFNNFRQDGLNMLPNPHWAWKLENGKYVIDHKYKKIFNKIDELAFDANKNVSQSQKEDIENILKIKVDFGIELATQNKALSKREQILQKVINSSTDVIQIPQSSKDELRMWTNINEDYKKVLYYLSDNVYGRNVNVKDKYGKTALHYAVEENNLGLVQSLIKDKAKVNSLDKDGRTALHRAVQLNYVNIVEYLIKNGANIDKKDKYNRAIIHHSVRYGALTKRLIEDYQV
ncbi:MAG: ankyrin repeat domain-containing protein, partial [Janthinobacterium lividum]